MTASASTGSLIAEAMESCTEDTFNIGKELPLRAIEGRDAVAGFMLGNMTNAMQDQFGVDVPHRC